LASADPAPTIATSAMPITATFPYFQMFRIICFLLSWFSV
jgi:hypothetical protein